MATTVELCEAMIAAAKAADVSLGVNYRLHWEPHHVKAVEALRNGAVGDLSNGNYEFSWGYAAGLSDPRRAATIKKWLLDPKMAGGGAIVNIASVNAERPAPGQAAYSMTKAGIVNLTQGFAKELAPRGIRVNAVLPGLTDTHFASAITQDAKLMKLMTQLIPMARAGQPAEIAPAVLFLASNAANDVTGTILTVDGGYLA